MLTKTITFVDETKTIRKFNQMKLKLKFVKFSWTFRHYFSSAGCNLPWKCAYSLLSRQPCVLRTVWLRRTRYVVAIVTPVMKCVVNLSESYLVWSHSFWCDTWVTKTKRWLKLKLKFSKFSSTRLKLRLKVSQWLKLKLEVNTFSQLD